MLIGELIKKTRNEHKLTLRELAKISGVDYRTIGRIERTSNGNHSTVTQVVEALGMKFEVEEVTK